MIMPKPKYKLTEQHLDTRHGIAKLERDGFTRQDISRALYDNAGKISADESRNIMKKLHDRSGEC